MSCQSFHDSSHWLVVSSFNVIAVKANTAADLSLRIPVAVDGVVIGRLVCVDRGRCEDHELQRDLSDWRARYMKYFLTQFKVSHERTLNWLRDVVLPSPDRLLFTIETADGIRIGHIGLCNIRSTSIELDNLIRGRKGGGANLIRHSEIALLKWGFKVLNAGEAALHVFSNNRVTIALHESVGFVYRSRSSLTRVAQDDECHYVVGGMGSDQTLFQYVEMTIDKSDFFQRHGGVAEMNDGR